MKIEFNDLPRIKKIFTIRLWGIFVVCLVLISTMFGLAHGYPGSGKDRLDCV